MTEQAEVATDPPPSLEARALGAIGHELDVVGDALSSLAAGVSGLQQLGEEDAVSLRGVHRKLDKILDVLTNPATGLVARLEQIEMWRGDHEREHAAE